MFVIEIIVFLTLLQKHFFPYIEGSVFSDGHFYWIETTRPCRLKEVIQIRWVVCANFFNIHARIYIPAKRLPPIPIFKSLKNKKTFSRSPSSFPIPKSELVQKQIISSLCCFRLFSYLLPAKDAYRFALFTGKMMSCVMYWLKRLFLEKNQSL